jgi:hypothetical protein
MELDNYRNFLTYKLVRSEFFLFCFIVECTDSLLAELVKRKIINQEERYAVFSYPLPSVFNNVHRYWRLFEILRDSKRLIRFLRHLTTLCPKYPCLAENLGELQKKFYKIDELRFIEFYYAT